MVTNQGESSPVVRNVMTLDTCAAIIGSEVMSFKTEQELLTVIILLPPQHVCFCWHLLYSIMFVEQNENLPLFVNPPNANMDYALQLLIALLCALIRHVMHHMILLRVIIHAILQPTLQLLKCMPRSTDLLACCVLNCT